METKTYTTIDRAALGWPSGEWDGEPDKVQWQDEQTRLPCLAVRNTLYGNWCGYVGVAEGHRYFGADYSDPLIDVHGGLTFANACQPEADESKGVCHMPEAGEPDHVWWLGFDCAHAYDASPDDYKRAAESDDPIWQVSWKDRYRNLSYVQQQCKELAAQLVSP